MQIPKSDRIVFELNPLAEVICQVRFPPLLEIEKDLPVSFHRKIRDRFPKFNIRQEVQLVFSDSRNAQEPNQVVTPHFDFTNEEGNLRVTLTRDFIALTDTDYKNWGRFRDDLAFILEAARETYGLKTFTRVGLRYVDVIDRATLELEGVPWEDLIKEQVLGIAGTDLISSEDLSEYSNTYAVKTENGQAKITTGLARKNNTGAVAFLIDSDFATHEKLDANDETHFARLDEYNRWAGEFFRWCIKEKLRDALKPT